MDPPTVAHTDGLFFYALPFLLTRGSFSLVDSSTPFRFLALWPLYLALLIVLASAALVCWASPGGPAWGSVSRGSSSRRCTIPGPRGWPVLGCLLDMGGQAHRKLATLARHHGALSLMAFSLGSTRVIITSSPGVARELLSSPGFADRPLKQSAQQLMFGRAIGFAPYGDYWRKLRRIAATHLFAPKRIAAHERYRQYETTAMLEAMALEAQLKEGIVQVRSFLQHASLNNIMVTVFGRRYNFGSDCEESKELHSMVREGFDLLGAFNMADHLHALRSMDPQHILQRCAALVPRVTEFVMKIINDHKHRTLEDDGSSDFVDVLLALQDEEQLDNSDLVAILWEMIFRGTDTMAILTEWILAELILNPKVQSKLHAELDGVVGRGREVCDADLPKLPYLLAVVKEALRMHPPGPLLSWARLATHDLKLAGHHIPAGTTAMVNMWSITHDPSIWSEPDNFVPERFMVSEGGTDVDIRGNDLRLAPFGAGRRVCPGRALGLATVHMWVGRLLQRFEFTSVCGSPVDLSEVLKLSCEMVTPLSARLMDRSSR